MKRVLETNRRSGSSSVLGLVCLVAMLLGTCKSEAQNFERMVEVEADQYADFAMVNSDYQTLKTVRRYWVQEVQHLKSIKQYEFSLTGSSEAVLKVTIPVRLIFMPNDSTMLSTAEAFLRPLLRWVNGSDAVATMIVSCYSDNNGSERYLQLISGGRARQIYRWYARQGVGPAEMRSYGFGNKVPRTQNESIGQRERNRRVSIYFVPNKKMIKNAKNGKL